MDALAVKKLVAEQAAAETDAERTYWSAIRSIVDGAEVDVASLAEARRVTGRSIDAFEADCNAVIERRRLRAELDRRAGHEKAVVSLQRQIDAADAKLREAEAVHEKATAPLRFDLDEANRLIRGCDTAAETLARTVPYPWLNEAVAAAETARRTAHANRSRLIEQIKTVEAEAEYCRQVASGKRDLPGELSDQLWTGAGGVLMDRRESQLRRQVGEKAAKYDRRAEGLRGELADADAGLADADAETKRLRAELLNP